MKRLTLLGATGSIGTQTLDVVREHPELFRIRYLSANRNVDLLERQVDEFRPEGVVLSDREAFEEAGRRFGERTEVLFGEEALARVCSESEVDVVVNGLVGFAGLSPTLAAASAGKRVALANKEALVVAGDLVMRQARACGAEIIPVDSEHSALFQVMIGEDPASVSRMILTASGGPFRNTPAAEFDAITPEHALKHPNWDMGAKITIDSATLMNKGLEVIEAARLFNLSPASIEVVVHPESIVHSMVLFVDGSIKAQLSHPDMRMPIRFALGRPQRLAGSYRTLDFAELGRLTFEAPDTDRFPCLNLAFRALARGGTAPTVLNAANEVAVRAFLEGTIGFSDIPRTIENALDRAEIIDDPSLHDIFECDKRTRNTVRSYMISGSHPS